MAEVGEGHEDLHVEIRGYLARELLGRGRVREAWALLEDALHRFRKLERKMARWTLQSRRLDFLYGVLASVLRGTSRAVSTPRASLLKATAFDAFRAGAEALDMAALRQPEVLDALALVLSRECTHETISELLRVAVRSSGAQRALFITHEAEGARIQQCVSMEGFVHDSADISWAVVSEVMRHAAPRLYADALAAAELASHRSVTNLRLRSLACIPIMGEGGALGALYLDHQGVAGLFHARCLHTLQALSGIIGLAWRTVRSGTDVQQSTSALQDAHRQLLRAERNRVAGELVSGIAHDLKNLLAAVVARSQLLMQSVQSDAVTHRSLKSIETAAQAGARLIERVQQCSREHGSEQPEAVDVAVMAHDTLDLLAPRLSARQSRNGRGIEVTVHADPGAIVDAPPGELREVFLNLFVNACEAMPTGGTLHVGVSVVGREVGIMVRDSGCGMTPATRARAFEPFFTTKGTGGTGMGLAVVQSIIVRLGGAVTVESEEGKGTCFRIVLPRTGGEEEKALPSARTGEGPSAEIAS
jgi:signal transduction histidine kinase